MQADATLTNYTKTTNNSIFLVMLKLDILGLAIQITENSAVV
jgi:hypothetical protein